MIGLKPENSEATVAAVPSTFAPWQIRVYDEKHALNDKIGNLASFLAGEQFPNLPADEQKRLSAQLEVMKQYRSILSERIAAWDVPSEPSEPEIAVEVSQDGIGTV